MYWFLYDKDLCHERVKPNRLSFLGCLSNTFKKFNGKTFLLHLNVRSLSQNLESLNELLATIKFELKVIYLTEPWMVQEMKHYLI